MQTCRARRRQEGFTLLAVLGAMLLLALATERVTFVASQAAQRQREEDLLRIGTAYADAVRAYYLASPGAEKRWPASLTDLTGDRRFVQVRRHLREPYPDPLTRGDWLLLRAPDGGIAGVYSSSTQRPIRSTALQTGDIELPAAGQYSDWKFAHRLPAVAAPMPASATP
jgi:type II secretory pathway pseudopilin PulG